MLASVGASDLVALAGIVVAAAITAYGTYKAATAKTHDDRVAVASDRGSVETTAETFKSAIEGLASAADSARKEASAARQEALEARQAADASRAAQAECEAKYATLEGVVDDLVARVPGVEPRPKTRRAGPRVQPG